MLRYNVIPFLFLPWFFSCQYRQEKQDSKLTQQGSLSDEQLAQIPQSALSFALIRTEVFEPNCFQCHSAAGGNKAGVNLESYGNVFSLASAIQSEVSQNFMPPKAPLTEKRKEVLFQWIQMGMPEFAKVQNPTPTPTPTPTPITDKIVYKIVADKVFSVRCIKCHGAGDDPDLSTYSSVKLVGTMIKKMVSTNQMPPKKPLPEEEKSLLLSWIAAGMPENANAEPIQDLPTMPPPIVNSPPTPSNPSVPICEDEFDDDTLFSRQKNRKCKCKDGQDQDDSVMINDLLKKCKKKKT